MTITRPEHTAATFSFVETRLGDGSIVFDYDGLIKASDQATLQSVAGAHTWQGKRAETNHAPDPNTSVEPGRICCNDTCSMCPPNPPCVGTGNLRVEGKHVAINATVELASPTLLRFHRHSDQRVPIFASQDQLLMKLNAWHHATFDAKRSVVYHIYEIVQPISAMTGDDKLVSLNTALVGHVIAIPIEPRWPPAPAMSP